MFMTEFKPGELVVRRYRWGINSQSIGLIVGLESTLIDNICWVLWTQDIENLHVSECHPTNLLVVNEKSNQLLGARCQITT